MRKNILFFVIPALMVLALGGLATVFTKPDTQPAHFAAAEIPPPPVEAIEPAAGESTEAAIAPAPEPVEATSIAVEGTDPKFPKSIGKLDAPVTMYDFSSLTCPHCALAHHNIIPQLIRDYVDTGKLRIVFWDFPLNAPAMDASKVSRCMSSEHYFAFISLLFSSQEQWISNHPAALIQNAVLAGLPADKAKACLEDTTVEEALIEGVRNASTQFNVQATPTFVFNDGKKVIEGARQYIEFQMAIDGLIEEAKDAAAANAAPQP